MILKQNGGISLNGTEKMVTTVYTPVPHKMIVGADDPIENERVSIKESRTKKVYSGVIIKKGMFCPVAGCTAKPASSVL